MRPTQTNHTCVINKYRYYSKQPEIIKRASWAADIPSVVGTCENVVKFDVTNEYFIICVRESFVCLHLQRLRNVERREAHNATLRACVRKRGQANGKRERHTPALFCESKRERHMKTAYAWPPQRLLTKWKDTRAAKGRAAYRTHALCTSALTQLTRVRCYSIRLECVRMRQHMELKFKSKASESYKFSGTCRALFRRAAKALSLTHTTARGWMCECELWRFLLKCKCLRRPLRRWLRCRRRSQRSWWVCTSATEDWKCVCACRLPL